jgi:acetone carboxylase gamma subunit
VIYEFYCPGCGTRLDVEYTVPGHMPLPDIDLDVDSIKQMLAGFSGVLTAGAGEDVTTRLREAAHNHGQGDNFGNQSEVV